MTAAEDGGESRWDKMGVVRISAVVWVGRDGLDLNCGGEEEGMMRKVNRAGFLARCQGYKARY